jgi:hypothetical protein
LNSGLDYLTRSIEHNVDQSIQGCVTVRLLHQTALQDLLRACVGHVRLVIPHDGRNKRSASPHNFLNNVAEIVNQKMERVAPRGDTAEQPVDSADHGGEQRRDVVDGGDEQGIKVERREDAVDDIGEVAQPHDELERGVDVGDGQVDLLDRDLDSRVDGNELGDVGIEIDVGGEIVHVEFYAADGELRDVEIDIRERRVGCRC